MQAANLKYEEARMRLYRLSSMPGSDGALDRITKLVDKEIGALESDMMAIGLRADYADTAVQLSAAEKEVAEKCGLSLDALKASKARAAMAVAICAKIPTEQLVALKIMYGVDQEVIAARFVQLKSAGAGR